MKAEGPPAPFTSQAARCGLLCYERSSKEEEEEEIE